jgi:hypothetical protein
MRIDRAARLTAKPGLLQAHREGAEQTELPVRPLVKPANRDLSA